MSDCRITACANPHAFDETTKQAAIEALREGKSHKWVASVLGIGINEVRRWQYEAQSQGKLEGDPIIARMHLGHTCAEIAAEMHREASEIHDYIVAFWKADKEQMRR